MKISKLLMIVGMCLCLSGCAADKSHTENTQENKSVKGENQLIASGNMYEITDNNFTKGLEHEFTDDELKIWNAIYNDNGFEKGEETIEKGNIKYMINLYDSQENEVGEYMADKDGNLYDGKQDGSAVYNQEITELIRDIIS